MAVAYALKNHGTEYVFILETLCVKLLLSSIRPLLLQLSSLDTARCKLRTKGTALMRARAEGLATGRRPFGRRANEKSDGLRL